MGYLPEDIIRIRKEKNLTQKEFADKLGISRVLLNKMEHQEDAISKASVILLDNFCKQESKKNIKPVNEMDPITEKLIASLEAQIKHLNEVNAELKKHNTELQQIVQANLQTVLNNQLAMAALSEAALKQWSLYLTENDQKKALNFRVNLHKEAFERQTGLKKTGNSLKIDNESIVSEKT